MNNLYRHKHDIHGVLLLDKPKGLSSNSALQKVKHIYNAKHAGHTGSLDPLATGMLPICFGKATKFAQYSLNSNKRYRVIAKLGQRTDTFDSDGRIIQERPVCFDKKKLDIAMKNFLGSTLQIPPMYSAIKYQGKKLYEYIRQGIEVPRKPRLITIYELIFIRYDQSIGLELEIFCSKGTYIRTIIDDLGEKLGCGAHIVCLRRISIANYPIERMVTFKYLQTLVQQASKQKILVSELLYPLLMPIDSLINHYPTVHLSLESSLSFKQGNPISVKGLVTRGLVRVTEGIKKKFIGVGEIDYRERIVPRRLVY